MPNPVKQLERRSWAAGYADGYIDGLEEAWARINAEIEGQPMPQPETDVAIALANKLARIAWGVLAGSRTFEASKLQAA